MKHALLLLPLTALTCYAGEQAPITHCPPPLADTSWGVGYAGIGGREDAVYGYAGTDFSLSGDYNSSGWVAGIQAGYGEFSYDNGTDIDGEVTQLSLAIGYRWVSSDQHFSITVGPEFTDIELDPNDPSNEVEGDELGAKVNLSYGYLHNEVHYLSAMGSYSGNFDSYWSRLGYAYNFSSFSVGPEVIFMGNEEWEENRYGLSIGGINLGFADLTIAGGHSESKTNGDTEDGFYASAHLNFNF